MLLEVKAQQCQLLREKIEQLLLSDFYSVDEAAMLTDQLNQLLSSARHANDDIEAYAEFLQQNLDWLQKIMAKLFAHRDAVAESMLTLQKGRRARHSYGQHN